MDRTFLPGLELARRYYSEVVRPLLDQCVPGLAHSAALLGWGSDVLGYDSVRSTDHNWGPRCQILVGPADAGLAIELTELLADRLPATFLGWPTRFADAAVADAGIRHWVEVAECGHWLTGRLGFDPRAGVRLPDWLGTPAQVLAEVTAGAVFHDGLGDAPGALHAARAALAWYPDDLWRHVLACQWQRISQEEAFPGRCAEAGDDLGSVIITARLARDLIRLVLLMHRRYPPYGKWLGTAFAELGAAAAGVASSLSDALAAARWPDRERSLCAACSAAASMHNELGLTEPVDVTTRRFHDRPYLVIDAGRFTAALRSRITDPVIEALPLAGTVDQFVDSTDAANNSGLLRTAISAQLNG